MSELVNKYDSRTTIRWKLLTGASALTLVTCISSTSIAKAEDADRPPIWLEISGQFAQQKNSEELFLPDFVVASPFQAASRSYLQKAPPTAWDGGAKLSFQPDGTDWNLSLGVRYGRSGRRSYLAEQTAHKSKYGVYAAYQLIGTRNTESHTIVDFQAGKDIGLGSYGSGGRSTVSVGVRYAQFDAQRNVGIRSQPTNVAYYYGTSHKFYAMLAAKSDFHGVGPSISWNASTNIAGNATSEGIGLDWGINAALLFGRQKVRGHHENTNMLVVYGSKSLQSHSSTPLIRSKGVTVPNLGGFAAVSWNYAGAKVSLGYRADMFFNAIDGGIDAAKKENRAFYGPFASISIGLGN